MREQLLRLLQALLLGALLGLSYDLLRPPRRRAGLPGQVLLDLLYSALSACALFCFAMRAPDGLLGLWELAAAAVGFGLYMALLSPLLLPALQHALDAWLALLKAAKKWLKKMVLFAKKCFPNLKE